MDKRQVAKYLGVNDSWVDKAVSQNKIPYIKVGKYVRFKQSTIDKWIETHTVRPITPFDLIKQKR